jgi:hypothetical protein
MISFNLEMFPKKVRTLDVHCMQNGQHLFFICLFSQVSLKRVFTSKGQWYYFLHENYINSFPKGITLQNKYLSEVEKSHYWSHTHNIFQILEGLIDDQIPTKIFFL